MQPQAIIIMGVSGSGKSTLGAAIAATLGCAFLEGDGFHDTASVAKMRAGEALTDADRGPWLDRIAAAANAAIVRDGVTVIACSALRRAYRDRLIAAIEAPVGFVLLDTDRGELARRMDGRSDHYMPGSLLDSQLATLERPEADEPATSLDARRPLAELRWLALAWLGRAA